VANATTVPTVLIEDLAKNNHPKAAGGGKRGLIFGVAGAAALVVVGVIAFGRSGSGTPTGGTGSATSATPENAPAPKEPAAIASAIASAASSSDANLAASATPTSSPVGNSPQATQAGTPRPPNPNVGGGQLVAHRPDPGAKPGASAVATVAAAATTAAPPTASATAKPAASARKFRTNID